MGRKNANARCRTTNLPPTKCNCEIHHVGRTMRNKAVLRGMRPMQRINAARRFRNTGVRDAIPGALSMFGETPL